MFPLRDVYINKLGWQRDGWAELIENMSWKVEDVKRDVINQLNGREMPNVNIEEVNLIEGIIYGNIIQELFGRRHILGSFSTDTNRNYLITTTSPGATTTIYIGKHGKDLYTSWRSFIRPIINKDLLGIYITISVITTVFEIAYFLSLPLFDFVRKMNYILDSQEREAFRSSMGSWIFYTALIGFGIMSLIWLCIKQVGRSLNGELFEISMVFSTITGCYFGYRLSGVEAFHLIGEFDLIQLMHFIITINGKISIVIGTFIISFFFIIICMIILGIIRQWNPLAYILKQLTVFDLDDISALNFSVHKSMLHALDMAGIDSSRLRYKAVFKGNRRGEEV